MEPELALIYSRLTVTSKKNERIQLKVDFYGPISTKTQEIFAFAARSFFKKFFPE